MKATRKEARRLIAFEMGYSEYLEIPQPLYAQGELLDLVYPLPYSAWWVLPDGKEDFNGNYLRCSRMDAILQAYQVDLPAARGRGIDAPEFLHLGVVRKAVFFRRGRLRIDPSTIPGRDDYHPLYTVAQDAYWEFLQLTGKRCLRLHRWDLKFDYWCLHHEHGDYRDKLIDFLRMGWFELSDQAHERIIPEVNKDCRTTPINWKSATTLRTVTPSKG